MLLRLAFWFLFVLIAIQPLRVGAHDHDPANDAWFKSLTNNMNGSCCDGSDAFSVEDPDWRRTADPENPFQVFYKDKWLVVNIKNVVKQTNKIGVAKVWPIDQTDDDGSPTGNIAVRCFMPGLES